ncbi:hypothetical protein [Methylophilus sp.]
MLKRFYIYVLLSMLFAVTQISLAAHEISHLNELASQSQPDSKHTGSEPCTLCLSLSLMAGALPTLTFVFPVVTSAEPVDTFASHALVQSFHRIYAARAPPVLTQL